MAAALEDRIDAPPLARRMAEDRGARVRPHRGDVEARAVLGRRKGRALALDRVFEEARLAQLRLLRGALRLQGLLQRLPLPRPPLLGRGALGAVRERAVAAEAGVQRVGAAVAHHEPGGHELLGARASPLRAPHVDALRVVALTPSVALPRRNPGATPALAHVRDLLPCCEGGLLRRAEDDRVGGRLEIRIAHLSGEIAG